VREAVFGSGAWFILSLWTMQYFCMGCAFMRCIQGEVVRREGGEAVCKERMARLFARREWRGVCRENIARGF